MPIQVASLEAVLDLNKKAFEKDLRATDKGLDQAKAGLVGFTKQTDKLGDALGDATKRGRLGLGEVDRGAIDARGSLGAMMASLSGGAANAAESTLDNVSGNVDKLGKSADDVRAKFGKMTSGLSSRMDKAGDSVKGFGKDADRTMQDFIDNMRKAADEVDDVGDAAENTGDRFGGIADGLGDMIPGLDKLSGAGGPLGIVAAGAVAIGGAMIDAGLETEGVMNMIQARTGATGRELDELGNTAQRVFLDGFGENAEDAASAVIQVKQVLGETGREAEMSAKRALTMRDVFDVEIPESLRAVRSATRQFGGEAQTTFDMMATTIQRVGDPYQDLADTVNEYSADLAQAGFTQAEFFGILERGVGEGARNFDVIADLVREFTIRIVDGSDTTKDALNELFEATGRGSPEMADLEKQIADTTTALQDNEQALEAAEGAYEAQAEVVDKLESELDKAKRKLDELARPNLKGVQEFDDKLFGLDQQAKRARLALLDLEEDTPAFEDTKRQLEEINKEMDRVALERDLTIGPQLREIEKAATEGREPVVSYEEALANVAAQKDKIAGLEKNFAEQKAALEPLAKEYERLTKENDRLIAQQDDLKERFANLVTPADEFLQKLASGEMTTRDAMSAVIGMLKEVENQVVADQIAVDLAGTKVEELGVDIFTALDPAVNKMSEFEGATDRAAAAMEQGLKPAWDRFFRSVKVGLSETFDFLAKGERAETSLGKAFSGAASALAGAVTGGAGAAVAAPDEIPSFASGGVIAGGPMGSPVIVEGHVGERITPPGQATGGVTVVVQGSINGEAHLQQVVMDAFGQLSQALAGGS